MVGWAFLRNPLLPRAWPQDLHRALRLPHRKPVAVERLRRPPRAVPGAGPAHKLRRHELLSGPPHLPRSPDGQSTPRHADGAGAQAHAGLHVPLHERTDLARGDALPGAALLRPGCAGGRVLLPQGAQPGRRAQGPLQVLRLPARHDADPVHVHHRRCGLGGSRGASHLLLQGLRPGLRRVPGVPRLRPAEHHQRDLPGEHLQNCRDRLGARDTGPA
mmetsp:Transcript_128567/g.357925  ORF Transcript_128567/g.357925 Transcript_128567/m.357925 type:complete len:217 (+) Transcript_128567:189-839(+)